MKHSTWLKRAQAFICLKTKKNQAQAARIRFILKSLFWLSFHYFGHFSTLFSMMAFKRYDMVIFEGKRNINAKIIPVGCDGYAITQEAKVLLAVSSCLSTT